MGLSLPYKSGSISPSTPRTDEDLPGQGGQLDAERLEEEEQAERLAEWRLGELQKVHVNKNKRKRGDDNDDMGGELDAFRLEQKLEALEKERCNLKEEVDEGRHQMQAMKETTIQGGSGEIPDSQFKIAV